MISQVGFSHNPPPPYPSLARRKGYQGQVVLHVNVSAEGNCTGVVILRSSGYALLDRAAAKAVREWAFEPATRKGIPVAAAADIPIRFVLN